MEPSTKIKNFDKRMTGASVIDDVLKEVNFVFVLFCCFFFPFFRCLYIDLYLAETFSS